jgi:hypothetical protein
MPSSYSDALVLEYAKKNRGGFLLQTIKTLESLFFRLRKPSNGGILLRINPKMDR